MTKTFLGIPIEGDINRGDRRVEQRPLEEFAPTLQAVLDDPLIASFGWEQYTPYFNDGDPCVFRVREPWFRTIDDVDIDGDDYDADRYNISYNVHPTLGHQRRGEAYTGDHEDSYLRARALNDAILSGAFDDVLLEAFGDHAEVTVTRTGITIEFYEHD